MIQRKTNCLAIDLACPSGVVVGQPVLLDPSANLTVKAIDAIASLLLVGTVDTHQGTDLFATIATRFRERRDDRVAAAAVTIGPFVYDATLKAVSYTGATFGSLTGTEEEPFLPVTGATDKIKCKEEGQSSETFTLAPTDTTAALIAAKINATAVHVVASAVAGTLKIAAITLDKDLVLEAVTYDDYTELGLTAGTGAATARSHDPGAIAGLIIKLPDPCAVTGTVSAPFTITNGANDALSIKIGTGDSQVFDLTAGTGRTLAQICADINATATDFTAVPVAGGYVKLLANDPFEDIEIETVANSAYATLGFTVAVTAAPMIINTLEK